MGGIGFELLRRTPKNILNNINEIFFSLLHLCVYDFFLDSSRHLSASERVYVVSAGIQ